MWGCTKNSVESVAKVGHPVTQMTSDRIRELYLTSNPRFPLHHSDSPGGGISITETKSPTCK